MQKTALARYHSGKGLTLGWIKRKFNLDCCSATVKRRIMKPLKLRWVHRARKPAVRTGLG